MGIIDQIQKHKESGDEPLFEDNNYSHDDFKKAMEDIFSSIDGNSERRAHVTVDSFASIAEISKEESFKWLKKNGTPLEYDGWWEVTLNFGNE